MISQPGGPARPGREIARRLRLFHGAVLALSAACVPPPPELIPAAAVPMVSAACALDAGREARSVFGSERHAEGWLARRAPGCAAELAPYVRRTDFGRTRLLVLATFSDPPLGFAVGEDAVEIRLPRRCGRPASPAFSRVHAMRIPREPSRVEFVSPLPCGEEP